MAKAREGDVAPDFTLPWTGEGEFSLGGQRGRWVSEPDIASIHRDAHRQEAKRPTSRAASKRRGRPAMDEVLMSEELIAPEKRDDWCEV